MYNRVGTHILRGFFAFRFLAGKEDVGFFVPVDGVIIHSTVGQHLFQFRPDGRMSSFIFLFVAGLNASLFMVTLVYSELIGIGHTENRFLCFLFGAVELNGAVIHLRMLFI